MHFVKAIWGAWSPTFIVNRRNPNGVRGSMSPRGSSKGRKPVTTDRARQMENIATNQLERA